MHEILLKASSKANNSFWTESRTGDDMGEFFACTINKAAPSFKKRLRMSLKADEFAFWAFKKHFKIVLT